jgi:hypothetical protein
MALLGDDAWCAVCKTLGKIARGANLQDTRRVLDVVSGGRYQAVGGDMVLCNCARPPRIVAVNARHYTIMDNGADQYAPSDFRQHNTPHVYDEQYVLRDMSTTRPLANIRYRVRTATGITFEGITDAQGRTQRVTTDGAETLKLEVRESDINA